MTSRELTALLEGLDAPSGTWRNPHKRSFPSGVSANIPDDVETRPGFGQGPAGVRIPPQGDRGDSVVKVLLIAPAAFRRSRGFSIRYSTAEESAFRANAFGVSDDTYGRSGRY